MTPEIKAKIHAAILDSVSAEITTSKIEKIIDSDMSMILSKTLSVGELLDAVGLEIRPKK